MEKEIAMARYVDGFVIPIAKNKVGAYKKIAQQACKIWLKYGALEYFETVGDDMKIKGVVQFPKLAKAKAKDTVIFAWIVYKSRAHRDSVNKKVCNDPWMKNFDPSSMPVSMKRMAYGGFKAIVVGNKRR